jgi:methionyl-tRNA formyltransferase
VAEKHGIKVFQPQSLSKAPEMVQELRDLQPDYTVMVAFGQILRKAMLDMPKKGVVNIHGSLLPKLRGAAPINWSIINGDHVAGVTTMFTEAGVDTGPMLLRAEVPVGADMNAEELAKELSVVGANLLIETLVQLEAGDLVPEPQNDQEASLAPMLSKEMGKIDWTLPGQMIHNLVRGLIPWPGTYTPFKEISLKIIRTHVSSEHRGDTLTPGAVSLAGDKLVVACGADGKDRIELLEVQPPGKGRMRARDWANGAHLQNGDVLGN